MGGIIATGAYAQAEKGDSDDMTKKTHELNPVVVTGTGTHQRLKNTPSPVSVITANEIKRAGITDFQQALTMMVPSLSFRPNAMGSYLMMNGLSNKHVLIVPINGSGERLGTLILARFGCPFDTRDLVLAEYLGTVVGLEILNDRGKTIEERGRERLVVQMAMRALSYSEVESVRHIIEDLGGPEGVVVASKVADRVGVTRSVIVNALRKLGSAGIIESRSLGMKGTYIKVLSPLFLEELGIVLR